MHRIDWCEFMRVDDETWNAERRAALDELNRLSDAEAARDQHTVAAVIDAMAATLARQFDREEREMAAAESPWLEWHANRHRDILARLADWRRRVAEDWRPGTGANFFLGFITPLLRHFGEDDRRLHRHLVDRPAWTRTADERRPDRGFQHRAA